jgi:hypothetical protein
MKWQVATNSTGTCAAYMNALQGVAARDSDVQRRAVRALMALPLRHYGWGLPKPASGPLASAACAVSPNAGPTFKPQRRP